MWHPGLVSNMNFPAPISVLGFLAACGGLALTALAIIVGWFAGKTKFVRPLLLVVGVGAVVYFALLFSFSLASRDHVLAQGQEKYFCEIDCHIAYAVVAMKSDPAGPAMHYIITLRTRFDETTISPSRPREVPLRPNPRRVELVDALGRTHAPASTTGVPLDTSLKPGESYLTELNFDLPGDAKATRLLVTSAEGWPEHVLIGDEQSPWHGKTWFGI